MSSPAKHEFDQWYSEVRDLFRTSTFEIDKNSILGTPERWIVEVKSGRNQWHSGTPLALADCDGRLDHENDLYFDQMGHCVYIGYDR